MFGGMIVELIIDIDDIVDVVVVVLIEDGYLGEFYEVIGLWLMMFVDMVQELLKVIGSLVQYVLIMFDDFYVYVVEVGGVFVVDVFIVIVCEILDG